MKCGASFISFVLTIAHLLCLPAYLLIWIGYRYRQANNFSSFSVDPEEVLRQLARDERKYYVPVPKPPLTDEVITAVRSFAALVNSTGLQDAYDADEFQLLTLDEYRARPSTLRCVALRCMVRDKHF